MGGRHAAAAEAPSEARDDGLVKGLAPRIHAAAGISETDKRKLIGRIAKLVGVAYAVIMKDLRGFSSVQADSEKNHLIAAREVVKAIGAENLISQAAFIWRWQARGVWQAVDDREIKQTVHEVAGSVALTRSICDSILDLVKTETYLPNHGFDGRLLAINRRLESFTGLVRSGN